MASKYLQKYPVPEGFQEILHDFTREVLRDQPDDIVKYAAEYFECQAKGKPFFYESKFNIAKGAGPKKSYEPIKPQDHSQQAKRVVSGENGRLSGRVNSASQNQNENSRISSGVESYADEKKITKNFVNDLYPKAVNQVVELDEDDGQFNQKYDQPLDIAEEQPNQQERVEGFLYAEDFNEDQIQKLIKIQSHVKGSVVRKNFKKK